MRKFTKSLLTLALLVLAVGGVNASVETVIKSFDYTTNPVKQDGVAYYQEGYPFYSQTGWWSATEATAPTLNAGALEITNASTDNYQLFINDWATVKKGYSYKAKVTYKSTIAGNVNFTFGTWGASLDKNVNIEETASWTDLTISFGTASFVADASAHLLLKFAFAGTIYIKKTEIIEVAPDVVTMTEVEKFEAPTGTTDIKNLTGDYGDWAKTVVYPKELAVQGAAFGNGNGDSESDHKNIEGYDYLCFYVTTAAENTAGLRVWIWDGEAGGTGTVKTLYAYPIANYSDADYAVATKINAGVGTYVTKVTGYKYLKGVKAANDWGSPAAVVSMAYMCTGDPVAYTPTGETTVSGTEYLADPAITYIDATGLTTSGRTFEAANPNALFVANDGMLANTKNVIVNGNCANLELVDGKPFNVPAAFTATAAKFTKTVGEAGYATMVIPFSAALPAGVEAYNITGNDGNVLTTSTAEAIVANKPVMLKNAGTYEFTASDAAIAATATGVQTNGLLSGVYAATAVPTENSYVLQNQSGDVNFYKAVAGLTIDPFRAYLTTATAGARLSFDFDQTTGIKTVETAKDVNVYNLQGVRVANPTKGLYIVNGKKAIVK